MDILKDSSYYQVLLKEGRELGRREGRIEGVRTLIIRQGRTRFGRLPRATRAAIEAIDAPERLEAIAVRIFDATSWDDLLSGPDQVPKRLRSSRR